MVVDLDDSDDTISENGPKCQWQRKRLTIEDKIENINSILKDG